MTGKNDYFIPVSFEGHPVTVHSSIFVEDGLLFFGRGAFYKYRYADRQIVSLPYHSDEGAVFFF